MMPATSHRPGNTTALVVVLVACLSAAMTAAVGLTVLHYAPKAAPGDARNEDAPTKPAPEEPFAQKGTVKAEELTGVVYYPAPYCSPPNLTLTAPPGSARTYLVTRQDEISFTWAMAPAPKDLKDLASGEQPKVEKLVPNGEEFTWEAKGVRDARGLGYPRLYEQAGTFQSESRQEGEVFFPTPYATPPNVALSGNSTKTLVTATTPLGFAWKNLGADFQSERGEVKWAAKGVKATAEQAARFAKEQAPVSGAGTRKALEQHGSLNFDYGTQGEVFFPLPYAAAPNVEVTNKNVLVTDVTARSFRWRDRHDPEPKKNYSDGPIATEWRAKGLPGPAPAPEK
jgi:hypothetical protein